MSDPTIAIADQEVDLDVNPKYPQIPKMPEMRYDPNRLLFEYDQRSTTTEVLRNTDPATYDRLFAQTGSIQQDNGAEAEQEQNTRFSLAGIAENRRINRANRAAIARQAQMIANSRQPRAALRVLRSQLDPAEGELLTKYFYQYYYAASPANLFKKGINILARGIAAGAAQGFKGGTKGAGATTRVLARTAAAIHRDLMNPKKTTIVGRLYRPIKKKSSQLQNFVFGRVIAGLTDQVKELFSQVKQGIEVTGQAVRNSRLFKRVLGAGRVLNTVVVKPVKGVVGVGAGLVNAAYKTVRGTAGTIRSVANLGTGAVKGGLAGTAMAIGLSGGGLPAVGALAGFGITTALAGAVLESYLARSRMTLNQYIAAGIKNNLYHQVSARLSGEPIKYMEEIKAKRIEFWRHNNAGFIDPTTAGRQMQLDRAAKGIHIPKRITFARSVSRFLNWGAAGALLAPLLPALGIGAVGGMLILGGGSAALQVIGDTTTNRLMKQFASGQMGKLFSSIPLLSAIDVADAAVYKSLVLRQSINGGALGPLARAFGYDPNDPRFASLRLSELEQVMFDVRNPIGMALTYINMVQYIGVSASIRNFAARFALNRLITPRSGLAAMRLLRLEFSNVGLLRGGPAMSFQILRATAMAPIRFVTGIFKPIQSIKNLINALRALKGFPLVVAASFTGGAIGTTLGALAAIALGLPVGTFAAIGATVGGFAGGGLGLVAGGLLGRSVGALIGSGLGPLGTFVGGVIGTFFGEAVGSFFGTIFGGGVDKITQIQLPQLNIVNPLTIIQGAWNLVKFITSPLRNLTDYADLAMMLVSMITFFAALASMNGGASTVTPGSFSEPVAEYLNNKPILIAADQIDISADGYSLNFNTSTAGNVFISGLEVSKSADGYTLSNEFLTMAVKADNVVAGSENITAGSLKLTGTNFQATASYEKKPTVLANAEGTTNADNKVNFCEILPSLQHLCK
jgi:hypothetical protein